MHNRFSDPSIPAGRWQKVLAAGSAAPGRISASAGEAASLGSPAQTQAPARLAGRWRTPAAPPQRPHPGGGRSGQNMRQLNDSNDPTNIWTNDPTSATWGSSAMNWERILRVSRRTWNNFKKKGLVTVKDVQWLKNSRNAIDPLFRTLEMLEEMLVCRMLKSSSRALWVKFLETPLTESRE